MFHRRNGLIIQSASWNKSCCEGSIEKSAKLVFCDLFASTCDKLASQAIFFWREHCTIHELGPDRLLLWNDIAGPYFSEILPDELWIMHREVGQIWKRRSLALVLISLEVKILMNIFHAFYTEISSWDKCPYYDPFQSKNYAFLKEFRAISLFPEITNVQLFTFQTEIFRKLCTIYSFAGIMNIRPSCREMLKRDNSGTRFRVYTKMKYSATSRA